MSIYEKQNRYALPGACYALNLDRFEMDAHRHPRCEIMYLVSGCCTVWAAGNKLVLKERQFVFLDQDVPHTLLIEPGVVCTLLNFEFTCRSVVEGIDLQELSEKSRQFRRFLENRQDFLLFNDRQNVGFALKDLIFELEKKEPDNDYLLEILFLRMLLELSRCSESDASFAGMLHLKKAKKFIQDNLYEELNVQMVAAHVGINHSYLQTLFSAEMNCGIMAYVNRLRMEKAAFLLKNSSMNVMDIAFYVGFNSRQHFGYMFERQFGMSPKQYRRLNGQNLEADTKGSQLMIGTDGEYRAVPLKNAGLLGKARKPSGKVHE